MKYEKSGLLLPERTQTPADHDIIEGFDDAHLENAATYEQLTVASDLQPAVFSKWHEGQNADLTAQHLDNAQLDERLRALKAWKQELISRTDIDSALKQAYRWRVNEDIAQIHMLRASANGNMRDFKRWNEYIYGAPDEDIYRGALDWVAHDAEKILAGSDAHPETQKAAQDVLAMLENKRGYRELLSPEEETFEAVRDDHMRAGGYYALLLAGIDIPEKGKIKNDVGDPALEHIVRENLKSDYDIVDASGSAWSVSHSERAIKRPATYNMPRQRFIGLGPGHEIGSHLLERVNGLRGPIELAASGLDRTENGNEGRATIREQVVYDSFDEFGKLVRWRDIMRRHIAISYAYGVGEHTPKTSSETYEFMNTIDRMYQAKLTPDDVQATAVKAAAKTDSLMVRVLRGTDGEGGAYLKDKVYLEGHVACWLNAAERGALTITEGDLGKFDITNPRHISLLQQYGLLPDNKE